MKQRKKILFVGWGTWASDYAFQVAYRKGLDIYLATTPTYPTWVKKYVKNDHIIVTNPYDADRILTDVFSFCHSSHIQLNAVASHFELNVSNAALLAQALSLPGIPLHVAKRSSVNKLLMRIACQKRGIPMPRFIPFCTDEELFRGLRWVGAPAMAKPAMFGHSYGVVKINQGDSEGIIARKLAKSRTQLNPKTHPLMGDYHQFNGQYLLEQYLDGITVSVDGVVQDKRIMICGLSEFVTSPETFIQEAAYTPGRISGVLQGRCFDYARRVIQALEFDHCGFHCEMKLTKKGPVLLEIAARPPGGKMTLGYASAYDADIMDMYIDICLGNNVSYVFRESKKFVLHRSVFTNNWGILTAINGVDALKKKSFFKMFWIAQKGSFISPSAGIPESLLYYQLSASSLSELMKREEEVEGALQFKLLKTPHAVVRRLL